MQLSTGCNVSKIRWTSYACESKQNIREKYSLKTHETRGNGNIDHKNPYFLHAINLCFNFRHIWRNVSQPLWKDTAFDIVKKVTYGASVSLSNISWLYMGLCLDKCNVSDRKSTRISCLSRNIFFNKSFEQLYFYLFYTHKTGHICN